MSNFNELVKQFQEKFETPKDPEMWSKLVHEETEELMSAFVNFMKELVDLNYVISGYINVLAERGVPLNSDEANNEVTDKGLMVLDIIEFWLQNGIPLPRAAELVHESNMSKLDDDGNPVRDPDTGKILKGPNYQPPENNIAQLLFSLPRHELEKLLNEGSILKENQ